MTENDVQVPNSLMESAQDHKQIHYDAIERDQSFYYEYQEFKDMILD